MKNMKKYMLAALTAIFALGASAQQVTTLYFLENAPMRHTINPAFQPVSKGYVNFTPLGWMSFSFGNNSLTMSDMFFVDPATGKTITPLHPNADKAKFLRQVRSMTGVNGEMTFAFLNFGFQHKDNGYITIGINERIEFGASMPKSMFNLIEALDLTEGKSLSLSGLGVGATAYTEFAGGYSYKLNDQWTVGGKIKFLLGQAYGGMNTKDFSFATSPEEWKIKGEFGVNVSGPFDSQYLSNYMEGKTVEDVIKGLEDGTFDTNKLINSQDGSFVSKVLTPSGFGAGIDVGFTYKPLEMLQLSVALNDLGFICWTNTSNFNAKIDTTFRGVGEINIDDPKFQNEEGNFDAGMVVDSAFQSLVGLLKGGTTLSGNGKKTTARMTTTRLNVGLDANFWDNRVGVGIVSATRLYNARLYEEITLGAAFRPFNWLSLAVSYSLLENGKYSNIGAGLSLMPYDGINMTLAMDYIPTSYAAIPGTTSYFLPDKAKKVNLALGFSICWGSNHRDQDKDGVWDKLDMCPNTPRGVVVDENGCPLDEDHDGVPDYLDRCPGTPAAAIGFVDSVGCPLDTDGDGVEDYKDQCPNTPEEAWGKVDSVGCPLDTDGDGVPDYIDECPGTPEAAWGMVDANGCPMDSDGDGVPDYLDKCPGTPEAAWGMVDDAGCPFDSDGDGVPDYIDECPNTPEAARGKVDAKGCELDTDADGVPDYLDECPTVPGLKENKGCPEVKREVRQLLQKAMQGIEFETGKATIKKKSYPLLNQIAKIFIENKNYIIEVQGHTDNVGKVDYNLELSDKRANSVRDYLIAQGVDFQRLTAVGYGMSKPIADNKTKAGRQKNRRVEFKITFEEVRMESYMDRAEPQSSDNTQVTATPVEK